MKKVIGAVVAGTLIAGMASADISITLNNRVRSSLFTQTETYATNGAKTSKLWDFSYKEHVDTLGIYAKGENCGADVEIALSNGQAAYTTAEALSDGHAQNISMDGLYDGYMNWGALKLTFGQFDSRHINRYNKTAVEQGLLDSDYAKYGVLMNNTFLKDFSNATTNGGNKAPALILDYTVNTDAAKVLLKGGLVSSTYSDLADKTAADDKSYQGAGYVAEVDIDAAPAKLQFLFRMPTQHRVGFGAYADITAVDNLNLALGFTYGSKGEESVAKAKWTAFAVDGRVFYKVDDPLLVGAIVKYENAKPDGADAESALYLLGTVQYVVNDLLTAQFDGGLYYTDLDDNDKKNVAENYIQIRPAVKIFASKNAAVTAGVEARFAINGGDAEDNKPTATKTAFAIPLTARVKL